MRLHARDEHARGKRLFDIVVRAEAETADLVRVAGPGRDHQDGQLFLLAHLPADREPVYPGQHQIEQQQVERARQRQDHRPGVDGGEGLRPGERRLQLLTGLMQGCERQP